MKFLKFLFPFRTADVEKYLEIFLTEKLILMFEQLPNYKMFDLRIKINSQAHCGLHLALGSDNMLSVITMYRLQLNAYETMNIRVMFMLWDVKNSSQLSMSLWDKKNIPWKKTQKMDAVSFGPILYFISGCFKLWLIIKVAKLKFGWNVNKVWFTEILKINLIIFFFKLILFINSYT